ncbi:MAG: PadR family transcriptional regulator [Dysosmobacter welbionis]
MFYVLLSLLRQERCGTEIVRYVDDATAGRVPLGPGTLYTILAKFQEEGLIREAAVEGRKRTYAITDRAGPCSGRELSRLRLCVADGEREELASERLLPGMRERHREKRFHAGGLLGYRPSGAVAGGKSCPGLAAGVVFSLWQRKV